MPEVISRRRRGRNHRNHAKGKGQRAMIAFENEIYRKYSLQPEYQHQGIFELNSFRGQEREVAMQIGDTPIIPPTVGTGKEPFTALSSIECTRKLLQTNAVKVVAPAKVATKTVTSKDKALTSLKGWAAGVDNEVLAGLFMDIVIREATRAKFKLGRRHYWTHFVEDGDSVGYTCELECDGTIYKSNGVMASELQAEQSAAEVCLRTLDILPALDANQLSIQPYTGGTHGKFTKFVVSKPYLYTSRVASNILEAFVLSVKFLDKPAYYVKNAATKPGNKDVTCVCIVDGKAFRAVTGESEEAAIQLSADKAAYYFGISHLQLRMEFRKHLRMYKYDFYRKHRLLCDSQPSKQMKWTCRRFAKDITYNEGQSENIEMVVKCPYFLSNLPTVEYQDKLIRGEIKRLPVNGQPISKLTDLCVSHVDESNPNVYIIGNKRFSIRMWCKGGKIYSTERKSLVEILPGHNICNLQCEYRVSLPSFEVYLHAVECGDLLYPNPPNLVTTSCGAVALYHDPAASPKDIFVLLQHQTDFKEDEPKNTTELGKVMDLLRKQILPDGPDCTPAEACESIQDWEEEDIKLLSEMTMDSVQRVLMKNLKETYDSRYNELFARPELPEPLVKVQELCNAELKRREEEEAALTEKDALSAHSWKLPESEYRCHFDDTGIYFERSHLCGMRSLVENTGIRITLGEMDKCSVVTIPVEGKRVRGAQSLYYIMDNHIQNPRQAGKDTGKSRQQLLAEGYKEKKKMNIIHNGRRYVYTHNEKAEKAYLQNVLYLNLDGTKVKPKVSEQPAVEIPASEEEMEDVTEAEVEENTIDKEEEAVLEGEENGGDLEEPMEQEELEVSSKQENPETVTQDDNDDDVSETAKETEETVEAKTPEKADVPSNIDPYSVIESETGDDTTDITETTFETLDEYKHVEDDDVGQDDDDNPVSSKKLKTDIVDDAEEKLKEEKKKEQEKRRNEMDAKRQEEKQRYLKRLREKRDGSLANLPPRDVESWHCEWVVIDRALELCPQFKKIHETTVFQDYLSRFLQQISTVQK